LDSLKDSAKIERACVKEREREREREREEGSRRQRKRERGAREREILKGEIPFMVVCMLDEVSS
jgi:hypothetical protein